MGFIDFTTGQVLTADQMDLVMRQSVMRFADSATRDTALTGVLAEGMIAYLDDTNEVLKYNGTAWVNVNDNDDSIQKSVLAAAGDIIVATAAGTPSALTIGTAGQILESDGTALSYVTPDSSPDDIITTQGDLIIGDGSGDAVRLPVGAADTVLTSDGTTLSFEAAAGGGGIVEFTLITSGTLSNQTLSINSIPQTFDDLFLRFELSSSPTLRFNGRSNTAYNIRNFTLRVNSASFDRNSMEIPLGNCELHFRDYANNINANTTIEVNIEGRDINNAGFSAGEYQGENTLSSILSTNTLSGSFKLYGVTHD